ncbi:hypothetical protein [Sulfitobacter sp. EhC04]|uniref:hypothetical protein n=1 Tax=Sulfitobacter sp. EhC04 TaxID=1849168 RepID=UPI0013728CCB|nr:hypothetical protein [Sulfitobacter sp. EhC04]
MSDQLDRISTLEELEGFAQMLFNPPPGVVVKPYTEQDRHRIANMKIEFQKGAAK